MSTFKKYAKLATEFVEYMAKPAKKSVDGSGSARPHSAKPAAAGKAGSDANPAARAKNTSGPLEVSYAPEADGEPDPGEVVWTYVSYEDDPSQGKDRPVAVIGWDGPVLGVVQLTSKDHGRNDCIPIGTGDWDRERRPSFAKIDRILRVKPADVRREGAVLAQDRFNQLVKELRAMHGWPLDTNDDA